MTDAELIRLPSKDEKYAAYREAVEWGIINGLVKLPKPCSESQVSDAATQSRRASIKKAQAVRLAKTSAP